MAPEQTNAKRHGPNRATTVICLVLILAAALVIARMVKFRSQVDVTLPAVLWEDGEATAVNTTLHFHGEMVKQWGQDDSFSGYLELEEQPFTSEEASKVWRPQPGPARIRKVPRPHVFRGTVHRPGIYAVLPVPL